LQAPRRRIREAHADVDETGCAHLEHLDFQHDLGLGQILCGDQALAMRTALGVVAHHQKADLLVE